MHTDHQAIFVIMAMIVAVFGSWTALDLFRRVRANVEAARLGWLAAAAVTMGLSIWSMHFVAMLGFQPPAPARYDVGLTLLSLFIAMATTAAAFFLGSSGKPGPTRLVLTGLAMGAGICAMHYTGMAALHSSMAFSYDPTLVALSYAVAAAASIGALFASGRDHTPLGGSIAAIALGGGIVAMHYTGMAAMRMGEHAHAPGVHLGAPELPPIALALAVASGTLLLLGLTLIAAVFDRRHEAIAAREAETLRQSRAQLRAVLEQMPIGVLVAEAPSGRVIFGNAQAEALLGVDGEHLEQADAAPPVDSPLERALLGQTVSRERRQQSLADGQAVTLEISASPVRDTEGHIALAVLTVQDMTAQLEAEEALSQAQKLDSLGRLTGGVAHDFNNLLTAVIGSLELAARRVDDERALRLIGNANEAAQRGARLTAQLLAFSRRQKLESQAVDLNGLISRMGDLLASTLGGAIRVECDLTAGLSPVTADPMQLELALLNLAINARDAMPEGGVLTFSTARARVDDGGGALEPKAGDYIAVTVSDTGAGMSPEILAKAVDPFFTTKPAGKGTGLGLSQVVGLARQLGGGSAIRSAPGEGTAVTLYLQRAKVQAEVIFDSETPSRAPVRSGAVMVVDDDEDVRRLVSELLADAGHRVIASDRGAKALAQLQDGEFPDVLLVDYAMPEMNGAELIRRARQLRPGLPVLMMTGYLDHAVLPSDIDEDIVLQKPFEPARLLDRLADLMTARTEA